MIDVVDVTFAAAQLEHVLERVDQVLAAEGHHRLWDVLVELAVDAKAADAAQAIAVLVEELFLEERLSLFELRRVARTQPGVNPHQRVFVARGVVVGKRVEDQRIADLGDALDALEAGGLNLVERLAETTTEFNSGHQVIFLVEPQTCYINETSQRAG